MAENIEIENLGNNVDETEAETSFTENETSFMEKYDWNMDDLNFDLLTERIDRLRENDATTNANEKRSETYRRKAYIRGLFGVDVAKINGDASRNLLEKISIEKDGGLSYEGTKVIVVDKKTEKLRYADGAARKLSIFIDALNNAHNERLEVDTMRRNAQERLTTQNNLEADAIGSKVADHRSDLGFDSRGLVGVLEMDVDKIMKEDAIAKSEGIEKRDGISIAGEKVKSLIRDRLYWETLASETDNKDDKDFFKSIARLCDRRIDEIIIRKGEKPLTEEGQRAVEETNDISRFRKVKEWMKENLGVMSAIGIGIAGVITTVVLNGRSVIRKGAQATSKFAKAVANLAKKFGAILGPILSIVGQVLTWGAKGMEFLSRNLWILAVALTYFVYHEAKKMKQK